MISSAVAGLTYDNWSAASAADREALKTEFGNMMRKIQRAALPAEAKALWDNGMPVNYVRDLYQQSPAEAQQILLAQVTRARTTKDLLRLKNFLHDQQAAQQLDPKWLEGFCTYRGIVPLPLADVKSAISTSKLVPGDRMYETIAGVIRLLSAVATFEGFRITVTEISTLMRAYQYWDDMLQFVTGEV